MGQALTNSCPAGNTQAEITLVIHGPTWKNRMPFDAHAMTVVLPSLQKSGWEVKADERLPIINVYCPLLQEARS